MASEMIQNLVGRLRAAALNHNEWRWGWLGETIDALNRLTRELEAAWEREREYRHVLISLTFDDRAGIASTEFGSHCLYCLRDSADLDPTIVHDDDCPVKAGRRVLAAYVHGGPRWLTRTARRGEGGGE